LPIIVQSTLLQTFDSAGYAQSVTRNLGDFPTSSQLQIDIRQFHVVTSGEPTAEIVFQAKLLGPSGEIVASKELKTSAPAQGDDARAFVDALSAAFDKMEVELLAWTTAALDAHPMPPVTVSPPAPAGEAPPAPDGMPPMPDDSDMPPPPTP
jgi:ABC-type uncharacterized transport system auxiliary subunit